MDPETGRPERPAGDLLAAMLGNATLLGLGYGFLRRWSLLAPAVMGTVLLVVLLAVFPGSAVVLNLLVVWWVAMIAHAWWLAHGMRPAAERSAPSAGTQDGPERARVRAQRIVAGVVVVALIATVVGLRVGTQRTVADAAAAQTAGDCERATEILDRIGPTDRIVYASKALDGAADRETCGRLLKAVGLAEQDPPQPREAAAALQVYLDDPRALWAGAGLRRAELLLDTAYDGDGVHKKTLDAGFAQLTRTLQEHPDQGDRVTRTVEAFLADLAEEKDDCAVRSAVEWVDGRDWEQPELAEPVAAASGEVPRRVLGCARNLTDADRLKAARGAYEAFLHDFGSDERADAAADELYDVVTGIQRQTVRDLLKTGDYCAKPQPYRGAAPYRSDGTNPMRVFGLTASAYGFPLAWTARDLSDMVVVACVDGPKNGSYQETCAYESDLAPYVDDVRFYASRFDVRLYEVRTGKQVAAFSDEFGKPCPSSITIETFSAFAIPPETERSEFTAAEIRGMFEEYQS